jgi:hypothetical protein
MGSITKTYVAVALLRAQARGLVDLDRPVTAYLEDVPGAPGVTVRQLLQMRSGIPDHVDGDAWVEAVTAAPARSWRLREVLSLVPDDIRRPGSFEYSNTNYLLAGLVLERATGPTGAPPSSSSSSTRSTWAGRTPAARAGPSSRARSRTAAAPDPHRRAAINRVRATQYLCPLFSAYSAPPMLSLCTERSGLLLTALPADFIRLTCFDLAVGRPPAALTSSCGSS